MDTETHAKIDSDLCKYIGTIRGLAEGMHKTFIKDPINSRQPKDGTLPCYCSGYLMELDRFFTDIGYLNGQVKELIGRAEYQQDLVTKQWMEEEEAKKAT